MKQNQPRSTCSPKSTSLSRMEIKLTPSKNSFTWGWASSMRRISNLITSPWWWPTSQTPLPRASYSPTNGIEFNGKMCSMNPIPFPPGAGSMAMFSPMSIPASTVINSFKSRIKSGENKKSKLEEELPPLSSRISRLESSNKTPCT